MMQKIITLVTVSIGLVVLVAQSNAQLDNLIDAQMRKMFIASSRMAMNTPNVQLPYGFWATNRIQPYKPYLSPQRSSYMPRSGSRFMAPNSVYSPRYTINRSINMPSMPVVANPAYMRSQISQFMPPFYPARRPRTSNKKINNFRGPIIQVNLKSKPAVNQLRDNKFFRKTNITASVEREAVGEFVANWNTEMKEISISGTKNETKIKTFKNNGNIHSHLGYGKEGEAHVLKIRRGSRQKAQSVPNVSVDPKENGLNTAMKELKSIKINNDAKKTMKYDTVEQPNQATKVMSADSTVTLQPIINLLPRRQQQMKQVVSY